MIKVKEKKAFILLNTSLVIIFILLLVGTYTRYTTKVTLMEFHKDLAKIRGYWGVYGSKELESSNTYKYYDSNLRNEIYDISVIKEPGTNKITIKHPSYSILDKDIDVYVYKWDIVNIDHTVIKSNLIFNRVLYVDKDDSNNTISYIK